MDREDIKMLVAKWWDIYNDEGLDFKAEDVAAGGESYAKTFSIKTVMSDNKVNYISTPSAA